MNDEMVVALQEGIASFLSRGPILGYSMTHTRVRLDPDRSEWDLQTLLLEPVMKYEATVNSKSMGNLVSDLTSSGRGGIA